MQRPVIHISEREAVHDFEAVLRLVDEGSDVVVDRDSGPIAICSASHSELAATEAAERDARDKMIYELHAYELNAEAADVLEYQALPE